MVRRQERFGAAVVLAPAGRKDRLRGGDPGAGELRRGQRALIGPLMGILGALVVVLAGILSLQQDQERWVEYRATAESLKHEKYLYLTGTDPYIGPDAFPLLVQRVEALISKEHGNWTGYSRQGAADSKSGGGRSD